MVARCWTLLLNILLFAFFSLFASFGEASERAGDVESCLQHVLSDGRRRDVDDISDDKKLEALCNRSSRWKKLMAKNLLFNVADDFDVGDKDDDNDNDRTLLPRSAKTWIDNLSMCKDSRCAERLFNDPPVLSKRRKWTTYLETNRYSLKRVKRDIRLNQTRDSLMTDDTSLYFDHATEKNQNDDSSSDLRAIVDIDHNLPDPRVVRKEVRRLSPEDRIRFFKAINKLKADMIDGMSKYDILIVYHTPEYAPTAHFCPTFFPFHREYLKNFELATRSLEPDLGLPYWDTTMDDALPNPQDSILWSDEFFGTGNGHIENGPFAHFKPRPDPMVPALMNETKLKRTVGENELGALLSDKYVAELMAKKNYSHFDYCVDPFLELVHGSVHYWMGGHMSDTRVAPNDPVFFFLHSFFDYIWEQWRMAKQTREQRATEFVTKKGTCNPYCSLTDQLKPFALKETDGLSNYYTDKIYKFEPTPQCNESHPDCDSPYLFCDVPKRKCLSKIRLHGNCTGYDGLDICYKSVCQNSTCVEKALSAETDQVASGHADHLNKDQSSSINFNKIVWHNDQTNDKINVEWQFTNQHSENEAHPGKDATSPLYGSVWTPITILSKQSDGQTQGYMEATIITRHNSSSSQLVGRSADPNDKPYSKGAAFAQLDNPFTQEKAVMGTITVYDQLGRPCQPMCLESDMLYDHCEAAKFKLDIHDDVEEHEKKNNATQDDIPFTPNYDLAKFLNWRGSERMPDKFLFICDLSDQIDPYQLTQDNPMIATETTKITTLPTSTVRITTTTENFDDDFIDYPSEFLDRDFFETANNDTLTTNQENSATPSLVTFQTSEPTTSLVTEPPSTTTEYHSTPETTTTPVITSTSSEAPTTRQVPSTTTSKPTFKPKTIDLLHQSSQQRHRENRHHKMLVKNQLVLPSSLIFMASTWPKADGLKTKLEPVQQLRRPTFVNRIPDKQTLFDKFNRARMISGAQTNCTNIHVCCVWWAKSGQCTQSETVQRMCPKECGTCKDYVFINDGKCANHNLYCPSWAAAGQCTKNASWMKENCRLSCRTCDRLDISIKYQCENNPDCYDYHQHCNFWAQEGECRSNPVWMTRNCPRACEKCLLLKDTEH